jgi:hypothetical protein
VIKRILTIRENGMIRSQGRTACGSTEAISTPALPYNNPNAAVSKNAQ